MGRREANTIIIQELLPLSVVGMTLMGRWITWKATRNCPTLSLRDFCAGSDLSPERNANRIAEAGSYRTIRPLRGRVIKPRHHREPWLPPFELHIAKPEEGRAVGWLCHFRTFQDMALRGTPLVVLSVVHIPSRMRQHRQETLAKGTWLTIFWSELVALLNPRAWMSLFIWRKQSIRAELSYCRCLWMNCHLWIKLHGIIRASRLCSQL